MGCANLCKLILIEKTDYRGVKSWFDKTSVIPSIRIEYHVNCSNWHLEYELKYNIEQNFMNLKTKSKNVTILYQDEI